MAFEKLNHYTIEDFCIPVEWLWPLIRMILSGLHLANELSGLLVCLGPRSSWAGSITKFITSTYVHGTGDSIKMQDFFFLFHFYSLCGPQLSFWCFNSYWKRKSTQIDCRNRCRHSLTTHSLSVSLHSQHLTMPLLSQWTTVVHCTQYSEGFTVPSTNIDTLGEYEKRRGNKVWAMGGNTKYLLKGWQ